MKETNIKLFPILDGLCGRTTPSTPASFRPDLWTLQAAVSEYEMEERTFYWLPDCDGGLCVMERDVFLRGTHDHQLWTSQRPEAGEEAYCVVLKGRDRDSPTGDIRSFDFSAHLRRLKTRRWRPKPWNWSFIPGGGFPWSRNGTGRPWRTCSGSMEHSGISRYWPENEEALVRTTMMEHRYQKGWTPKKDRAPPSGPVR